MRPSNAPPARGRVIRSAATGTRLCALLGCAAAGAAGAEPPRELSFEAASSELTSVSDRLNSETANVRAAEDSAAALRALRRPIISLDAQELRYEKTLTVNTGSLNNVPGGTALSSLSGVNPTALPGAPTALGAINSQVQQALPFVFASLPDSISLRTNQTLSSCGDGPRSALQRGRDLRDAGRGERGGGDRPSAPRLDPGHRPARARARLFRAGAGGPGSGDRQGHARRLLLASFRRNQAGAAGRDRPGAAPAGRGRPGRRPARAGAGSRRRPDRAGHPVRADAGEWWG